MAKGRQALDRSHHHSQVAATVAAAPNKAAVRRPSPPRAEQEETFRQKLREVKRLREAGTLGVRNQAPTQSAAQSVEQPVAAQLSTQNVGQAMAVSGDQPLTQSVMQPVSQPAPVPAVRRKVIINGKPAQKLLGDWALMLSSRGRPYYFHLKTQVSQWLEPPEWKNLERQEMCESAPKPVQPPQASIMTPQTATDPQPPPAASYVPQPPPPPSPPPPPPPPRPDTSSSKGALPNIRQQQAPNNTAESTAAVTGFKMHIKADGKKKDKLRKKKGLKAKKKKKEVADTTNGDNAEEATIVFEDPESDEEREAEAKRKKLEKLREDLRKDDEEEKHSRSRSSSRSASSRSQSRSRSRHSSYSSSSYSSSSSHCQSRHHRRRRSQSQRSRSRSQRSRSRSQRSRSRSQRSRSRSRSRSQRSRSRSQRSRSQRSRSQRSRSHDRSRDRSNDSRSRSCSAEKVDAGGSSGTAPKPVPPPALLAAAAANPQPVPSPDMSAVLAAKARIESAMVSGHSLISLLDRPPRVAGGAQSYTINPTWISEYNFPALLSRCKFPKITDALHELRVNRGKKRNPMPVPGVNTGNNKDSSDLDIRRQLFLMELKNPNNRHRLLSEKLGQTVFKIPDELWERSFNQFQIDLLHGVRLEARPHGFTQEDDTPVYTRTGKVAAKIPFPEDIVRCHAVVQAWQTRVCHCVYANKTYSIERDDRQWKKDLEECRNFLKENGY